MFSLDEWLDWAITYNFKVNWLGYALTEGFFPEITRKVKADEILKRRYFSSIDDAPEIFPDVADPSGRQKNTTFVNVGRREQQRDVILAVIAALNFDPLQIPDGGKAAIRKACLTRPKLFTSDSFDHAWKNGVAEGFFKLANREKYISK